jgi:hypothetical protein
MIHMKTKSAISKAVLVSKKDFEAVKHSSALSIAEKMTEQFVGEREEADKVGQIVVPPCKHYIVMPYFYSFYLQAMRFLHDNYVCANTWCLGIFSVRFIRTHLSSYFR